MKIKWFLAETVLVIGLLTGCGILSSTYEEKESTQESIPQTCAYRESMQETPEMRLESEEQNSLTVSSQEDIPQIKACLAGTVVNVTGLSDTELQELFYSEKIVPGDEVLSRIDGCSYQENDNIALEELCYVRVLYYGFDGATHVGELIVNREIESDIREIFLALYQARYPIERMELVDAYEGDDERSMADNNTSAFNYRLISGTSKLSNHSYGRAIDLNPFYNPYVYTTKDGQLHCEPVGAVDYVDRNADFAHKIDHEDLAYQLFTAHGFTWGGDWNTRKDYQHFEKAVSK